MPLFDNNKQKFPAKYLSATKDELAGRFGGVTAFIRSPAVGSWKEGDENLHQDEVVLFEITTSELDEYWWREYQLGLHKNFAKKKCSFGPQVLQNCKPAFVFEFVKAIHLNRRSLLP